MAGQKAEAHVIKLQILLRSESRSPAEIKRVQEVAESLGMKPTGSGMATVSAEMEPGIFESVFGRRTTEVPSRPPGKADFGSSGGAVSASLQVPEQLQEWVESVTVAPSHIRF